MIKQTIWRTFDHTHTAGIIPVSSNKKLFDLPWDDCLMPVGDSFTLVENAVVCAAAAGSHTIWIVCNDSSIPLIRKKVGEYVVDPKSYYKIKNIKGHRPRKRFVPIFYVPCNPKDNNKRDSLGYAALHGAKKASMVASSFSHWVRPDNYFVCSPYAAFHYKTFLDSRDLINSTDHIYFTDSIGKTIKDGVHIPFVSSAKSLNMCRKDVHDKSTSMWARGEWYEKRDKLPVEEQYSARFFGLDEVFATLPDDAEKFQLNWHYEITNWKQYEEFISSDNWLNRPSKSILPERTFLHPIGVDY